LSTVICAHAVSVGGYITGRDPCLGRGRVAEEILHQLPVLLGGGRPFFRSLPGHGQLRLVTSVAAPGVTHLHYEAVQ
jgi:hypothetical protein